MKKSFVALCCFVVLGIASPAFAELSGLFYGTYSGGDTGYCVLILAKDGTYMGISYSTISGYADAIQNIVVNDNGSVSFANGTTMGGATFTGNINDSGGLSGTWSAASRSGSFTMNRISAAEGTVRRYAGAYIGTYLGSDSGKAFFYVDSTGTVTGAGYSTLGNGGFTVSGTVSSSGTYTMYTKQGSTTTATTTGSISTNGTLSGTWSGLAGSGTYSGTIADSPSVGAVSGNLHSTPTINMSDAKAVTTYHLPSTFKGLAPITQFKLATSNGEIKEVSYWVRGLSGTVSDITLWKLIGSSSVALTYGVKGSQTDGQWWFETDTGSYVNTSESLSPTTVYYVHSVLKDNGPYDIDATLGSLADPQVLGGTRSVVLSSDTSSGSSGSGGGGGGGGGGCVASREASAIDLPALALFALMLALRRRSKN